MPAAKSAVPVAKPASTKKPAAPSIPVALVTGATGGIGKAVAKGLAQRGFAVTILARDAERGQKAANEILGAAPGAKVDILPGDLASQKSVRAAAEEFLQHNDRLDVLVHCAGVFLPTREETEDGVEATLATNYLGQFLLTEELMPALRKAGPARIVSVASRYGGAKIDFEDLQFTKRKFSYLKAVPASKLAQVLWTQEMAERLQGTGITVNAIHPGLVGKTKLLEQTGGPFRVLTNLLGGTPEKGADTAIWLATAPEAAAFTGGLWAKRKRLKTPGQGTDAAARKQLWAESEKLVA